MSELAERPVDDEAPDQAVVIVSGGRSASAGAGAQSRDGASRFMQAGKLPKDMLF